MLAPWLISHFPKHRVYVEPYGGGASVLLRKPRSYAEVYNDLNLEVVSFFKILRESPDELERVLRQTPFSRVEFEQSYTKSPDPLEAARRLVVRSFMGRGADSIGRVTGFRRDSNRSGSTPAADWSRYPDRIQALSERMIGPVIENRDAIEVILHFDGVDTLHYVDPPYLRSTRSKTGTYANDMDKGEDHEVLARTLKGLKGMVILSGYSSDLYDDLFSDWKRIDRKAYGDAAKPTVECIWLNQAAANSMPERDLFE